MSERRTKDFLTTYMEFTEELEAPDSYHLWTAVSLLASTIGRKMWMNMGHFTIYPNMFITLIGPAGRVRKGQAIGPGISLLNEVEGVSVSADSITREALIMAMDNVQAEFLDPVTDLTHKHSSYSIVSKEFGVFLGTANNDLIALLTDLYDAHQVWTYQTKTQGTDKVIGVCLNMLAASTSDWLVGSLPMSAIGGGFTSRILFVVESETRHKTPRPRLTERTKQLREDLIHDLQIIHTYRGEIPFSKAGGEFFDDWYINHNKYMDDPRFQGYSARKHTHLLKVAALVAVSQGEIEELTPDHLSRALQMINALEPKMVEAFGAAGRSGIATDLEDILQIVRRAGGVGIEKLDIQKLVCRDVHPKDFELVLDSLVEVGYIKPDVTQFGIIYKAVDDGNITASPLVV